MAGLVSIMLNLKPVFNKASERLSQHDVPQETGIAPNRRPGSKIEIRSLDIEANDGVSFDPYNRMGQFCAVKAEKDE